MGHQNPNWVLGNRTSTPGSQPRRSLRTAVHPLDKLLLDSVLPTSAHSWFHFWLLLSWSLFLIMGKAASSTSSELQGRKGLTWRSCPAIPQTLGSPLQGLWGQNGKLICVWRRATQVSRVLHDNPVIRPILELRKPKFRGWKGAALHPSPGVWL